MSTDFNYNAVVNCGPESGVKDRAFSLKHYSVQNILDTFQQYANDFLKYLNPIPQSYNFVSILLTVIILVKGRLSLYYTREGKFLDSLI